MTLRARPTAGALRFLSIILLCRLCAVPVAFADDPSVRVLVQTAADPYAAAEIRTATMQQLQVRGLPAVPELLALLQDPNPNVRAVAASALGELPLLDLDDDRAVDALGAVAEHDADRAVRLGALVALGATGRTQALRPLLAALDDPDLLVRKMAVVGLLRLRDRNAVQPLLRQFLKESDPEIQRNMVRALGAVGARAELEALRRSVTDPAVAAEVEQQIALAKSLQEIEGVEPREVPRARTLYFTFADAKGYLLVIAYGLLALPAVALAVGTFAALPLRAWPMRLGVVLLSAVGASLFGGIASFPGFSAGLGHVDPGGGILILVLPFLLAVATLPVVGCACFLRLTVAGAWNDALLNAVIWAGVYGGLQFGTWHFVPLILRGNYFWYGRHPGWHATQLGYTVGVLITCAAVGALAPPNPRGPGTNQLDAMRPATFVALLSPCVIVLGMGYLIVNIYSY